MRKHLKPLQNCLLSIALLLVGCQNAVLPPTRPVAYLYPSVMPADYLHLCKPVTLNAKSLAYILQQANALQTLRNAGLLDRDLNLLLRGLDTNGYAEIDARRAKGPIQWLYLASNGEKLHLRIHYKTPGLDTDRDFPIPAN